MNSTSKTLSILIVADTHIGFDQPVRPRVARRRRGPGFFASFRRVLAEAVERRVDLIVHCGDLLFRSKVPEAIVDARRGPAPPDAGQLSDRTAIV